MAKVESQKTITLTNEDISKLSNTFAWLIQEDKKQNPDLYKIKEYNYKHHENNYRTQ